MHVWTRLPCRVSSFWREQPHAALPSHRFPVLHWRNDAAAALDLLDAADWSDFLADAEFLDRSNKPAVQQLADKIRAAGHVRRRAVVR